MWLLLYLLAFPVPSGVATSMADGYFFVTLLLVPAASTAMSAIGVMQGAIDAVRRESEASDAGAEGDVGIGAGGTLLRKIVSVPPIVLASSWQDVAARDCSLSPIVTFSRHLNAQTINGV